MTASKDNSLTSALEAIVGRDGIVRDEEERDAHGYDARGPRAQAKIPEPIAVVRPGTAEQIAGIVRLANERRIPVIPYGGGTGLMGGAWSVAPAIVIDMRRMQAVREVDAVSGVVWVEAGVVLRDVDEAVTPHGLMIAHDPWTFGIATVGGAISTNGLGFLGGTYGSMGDQVLAVEAVMPDGALVRTRAVRPHSTGPDIARLLIAGEGEFGIITAAALRAFPRPESREFAGYRFRSFEDGFTALVEMHRIGLRPTVLDYGDRPEDVREATLYLGFDGFREEVAAAVQRSSAICIDAAGSPVERVEVDEFWNTRHAIAERFARTRSLRRPNAGDDASAFDYVHVSLPISGVIAYRARAIEVAHAAGLQVFETGLWVTPGLFSMTMTATRGGGRTPGDAMQDVVDELLGTAQDVGGSMEYCHGVGLRLAHLMAREHGAGLDVLRSVKRALDPHNIMNPGKLGL